MAVLWTKGKTKGKTSTALGLYDDDLKYNGAVCVRTRPCVWGSEKLI
jgi:hypothetical protein